MNWDEVAVQIWAAWTDTVVNRPDLFVDEVHENTVRGQLVKRLHVMDLFADFEIDEDFNVMNSGDERGIKLVEPFNNDTGQKAIDIVIHRPGHDDTSSNLVAIELKKHANRDYPGDIDELRQVTSVPTGARSFQYQHGLLLRYRPTAALTVAILFQDGLPIQLDLQSLLILQH